MEIINYLGEVLAKEIKISSPAARGLIKLAIKDELGPYKPLIRISFTEFKVVIENTLKLRLTKLGVQEVELLTKLMVDELTKNQSLITMSSV